MGAEYLSYGKSIATFALTFFGYIILVLASVRSQWSVVGEYWIFWLENYIQYQYVQQNFGAYIHISILFDSKFVSRDLILHCKCLQTNDRQTNVWKCYFYSQMNEKIGYSKMCYQQAKHIDI